MSQLTVLVLGLLSLSVFAQRDQPKDIRPNIFSNEYGKHSTHKVNPVEVLSKIEGNKECLYGEPECKAWAFKDQITLKITGMAEANFGGHNKAILDQDTVWDDYDSGDSLTYLNFKGVTENKTGTAVFRKVGWLQWGGQIPFEFKIEIHNDLGEKFPKKEFRIPLSDGNIYRFQVSYTANHKWAVETLPVLKSTLEFQGDFAQTLFDFINDGDDSAQEVISCVKPAKLERPSCFTNDWKSVKAVTPELGKMIYQKLSKELGVYSTHFDIRIRCEKPGKYNKLTELTCSLGFKD